MTIITIPKFDPVYNTVVSMGGTPTDYLITDPVNNFVSNAFTIEFWLLADPKNTGTILFYSLTGEDSIRIDNPQNINITINTMQTTPTGVSFVDKINNVEEWHYFTLSWSSLSGTLILYKDGLPVFTTILAKNTQIQPDGTLVVGQHQKSDGTFDYPYKGKITQLRIWDNVRQGYFVVQDMNRNLFGNSNLAVWQMPWLDVQLNCITSGTYLDGNIEMPILMGANTYPALPTLDGQPAADVYPISRCQNYGAWTEVQSTPSTLYSNMAYEGNGVVWAAGLQSDTWRTYFSNDNGDTWTCPDYNSALMVVSAVPGFMAGVGFGGHGIWVTKDNGVSYNQVNSAQDFLWVCVVSTTVMYTIKKAFQLLYSTDGGSTFTQITTLQVPVTQVQYDNGVLVALTTTGDLIYSLDNAANWQPLISNTLINAKSFTIQNGVITIVNSGNLVLMTTINMNMVVNWQLNEGYGCYGFDYSGNNNNGHMGGCVVDNDEEAWEISTRIESPQFIEGANDIIAVVSRRVSREIAAEKVAKKQGPVIGKAMLTARSAEREMVTARTSSSKRKAAAGGKATQVNKATRKTTPAKKATVKRAAPVPKKAIKKTKKK